MNRAYTRPAMEELSRDELVSAAQEAVAELGRRALRETEARASAGRERDVVEAATARHIDDALKWARADLADARKVAAEYLANLHEARRELRNLRMERDEIAGAASKVRDELAALRAKWDEVRSQWDGLIALP